MVNGRDNNNNTNIANINWNEVLKQDTRSLDDVYLGKVKGLYEPLIVIEKGTINKEKLYIPKSVIEKYDADILYLSITEQEAKDTYKREAPPTEDEIRQIEKITENRILASRSKIEITIHESRPEEKEQRQHPKKDEKKTIVVSKIKEVKEDLTLKSSKSLIMLKIDKVGIINRLKKVANGLKDILTLGTKIAKEKIWEGKDIIKEKIKRTTRISRAYVKRKTSI
jgi:hypothetical protein